jgi:hypothetical protein
MKVNDVGRREFSFESEMRLVDEKGRADELGETERGCWVPGAVNI